VVLPVNGQPAALDKGMPGLWMPSRPKPATGKILGGSQKANHGF
jgi:hypothetical protein